MKLSKPTVMGFASLWVIVAYLIHPYLSVLVLLILIAAFSR